MDLTSIAVRRTGVPTFRPRAGPLRARMDVDLPPPSPDLVPLPIPARPIPPAPEVPVPITEPVQPGQDAPIDDPIMPIEGRPRSPLRHQPGRARRSVAAQLTWPV